MRITLDKQVISQHCTSCAVDFAVVRGSAYDEGKRIGLYLIALHGHTPQGRLAHLAIAVLDRMQSEPHPIAAAMEVIELPEQTGFSFVDWENSPWKNEVYLGEMLGRPLALSHTLKPVFLHVAEHVLRDLPEVRAYFA